MVQYRGNHSQTLAKSSLSDNSNHQCAFSSPIHGEEKENLYAPSKILFSSELKSIVVYRLECCGCKAIYVGQTVRHLTTMIEEHREDDTRVGQHIRQCGSESSKSEFKWKKIYQASSSIKLLTLEAVHIRKERPAINTREAFRSSELTLRLYFQNQKFLAKTVNFAITYILA